MNYTDYAVDRLFELVNIPSPSGYTARAADYIMNSLSALGFEPRRTLKGTVFCDIGGEGAPLLLSAHTDTLGAMVRSVKSNGRLRYTMVGGYQAATIETENCLVHAPNGVIYSGTVQSTEASQHVYSGMGDKPRNDSTLEIVLDELVETDKDVRALGIDTGCYISFDPRAVLTPSGFIKSRHLDDKASCAVLLALAKSVADGETALARNVWLMFTVYEEVGHGAARVPDAPFTDMVVVDMGCVGDDLKCDETMVSICCKDSGGPYNYDLTCALAGAAKSCGARYALDIYPHYGSDAGAALRAGLEARHALIGPGVFASHGYERTHRLGVENTLKLLRAFAGQAADVASAETLKLLT